MRDALGFDEWVSSERERLKRTAVEALYALIGFHAGAGAYPAAIEYTGRLLTLEPWQEDAHYQMMRLLAANGQRPAALHQYEVCKRVLAREFGVEPSPATKALHDELLKAAPAHLAANSVPEGPVELPGPSTPFVGRQTELAEIGAMLKDPGCRLLTLVGLGGTGKTRLAVKAARGVASLFSDGVYCVPLASVVSAEDLARAVAAVLDIHFHAEAQPEQQLLATLASKQILLVLDNFEHLLAGERPGAPLFLSTLIERAPGVKLLVTSREQIDLYGEWVLPVAGMRYPTDERVSEADLENYDAIRLFVESARRARPGFTLQSADLPSVTRICRLVEGLPLGVELAANWLRVLECNAIARDLEGDLGFLTTAARDVPERHRSLLAVIEHSLAMLTEEEQRALRRMSVFRGPFRRQAAEAVAGATRGVIAGLLGKSALRVGESGRYDLHPLVRQYAAERLLGEGEAAYEATCKRHSHFFADWMAPLEALIKGPRQRVTLAEIEAEIDDVRLAWQWAIEHGWSAGLERMAHTIFWFCERRGLYREALTLFGAAVDVMTDVRDDTTGIALGRCLAGLGAAHFRMGHYQDAGPDLERSLAVLNSIDHPVARSTRVEAQVFLGFLYGMRGSHAAATATLQEALERCREMNYTLGCGVSYTGLGSVALFRGDYAEAYEWLRQSLLPMEEAGDPAMLAWALTYASRAARGLGRNAVAQRLALQAVSIGRDTGERFFSSLALRSLGVICVEAGSLVEGKELLTESVAVLTEIGATWNLGLSYEDLGDAAYAQGDLGEAMRCYRLAVRLTLESGALPDTLDSLTRLAAGLMHDRRPEQSLQVVSFVMRHPATRSETVRSARQLRQRLLPALTAGQVAAAESAAATLDSILSVVMPGEQAPD